MSNIDKQAVLSLSGGMDSSTLLLHLLANGYKVTALSFDYGQKHRVELERAQQLVDYLKANDLHIRYQVIKLDGLTDLLNSALVSGGDEVPEGHYAEDNMKATVVPNRNKIFSSLVQSVALSIANETEQDTFISLAQQMFPQESFLGIRYMFGRPWQNTRGPIRKKIPFSYQLGAPLCLFVAY